MKRLFTVSITLFFCTLGSVVAQSITPINDQQPERRIIEISATVDTILQPNVLEISILLSEEPSKGKVTIQEQETRLAKALKSAGVDMKKSLQVVSKSRNNVRRDNSYGFASYLLSLETVAECTAVFDAFAVEGITNARISRTEVKNIECINTELMVGALQKAKKTAVRLAHSIEQEVGKAVEIKIYSGGGGGVYNYSSPQVSYSRSAAVLEETVEVSLPTDLDIKPITVSRSVSAKFELL